MMWRNGEGGARQATPSAGRHLSAVHGPCVKRALVGCSSVWSFCSCGTAGRGALTPRTAWTASTATYDVTAALKWKKGRLNVSSTALVTNNSDAAVSALTFNAAPAKIGRMILGNVTAGDQLDHSRDATTRTSS